MQTGAYTFEASKTIFGMPYTGAVVQEVERLGAQRIFLVASRSLSRTTEAIQELRRALGARFVGLFDDSTVSAPRSAVIAGAALAREAQADAIVAIGGGSVMDSVKAMRLCLANQVTTVEGMDACRVSFEGGARRIPRLAAPTVPMLAVPTTLAGAESTTSAACFNAARGHKEEFAHPSLAAEMIILDPAITVRTPQDLWLSTGIRAVDHAVETICAVNHLPYSDALCLHALQLLGNALPRCKERPDDLEARLDAQVAAWMARSGVAGDINMGASHGIGHMLGSVAGVPHGHTSCVLLPLVLHWNKPVNVARQALVSEALGHPGEDAGQVLADFIAALGLPGTLRDVGITSHQQLETIATRSMYNKFVRENPRPIRSPQDVLEILELGW